MPITTAAKMERFLQQRVSLLEHLDSEAIAEFSRAWLSAFALNTKKERSQRGYRGFKWECFLGSGHKARVEGAVAMTRYYNQWQAPFVAFNEAGTWGFKCTSDAYPDLTDLHDDIYVTHHNMKWTMAFTHEQPDIGPFFCKS